jgi:hypothetical protein
MLGAFAGEARDLVAIGRDGPVQRRMPRLEMIAMEIGEAADAAALENIAQRRERIAGLGRADQNLVTVRAPTAN